MSTLPPFQVPSAIGTSFPQLIMLQSTAAATISDLILTSSGYNSFMGIIGDQGPPTENSGWALLKDIEVSGLNLTKETYQRYDLSDTTVQAIPIFMTDILNKANNDASLKNLVWTVTNGTVPGPEDSITSIPDWSLDTLNPQNGVVYSNVNFCGNQNIFSLQLHNQRPRHLGVYVEFYQGDVLVSPNGWNTRLPMGVSSDYETLTRKYLGVLKPTTPVAGIDVSTDAQKFSVTLPKGADRLEIVFGGIGNGRWLGSSDAAGVILTFVLDLAVPLILANAKKKPDPMWFDNLLDDVNLLTDILNVGEYLLDGTKIDSVSAALGSLSDKLAGMFLSDNFTELKRNINDTYGQNTVENALPYVGWPAQTLKALLDSTEQPGGGALANTTCPMLSIPPSFELSLAPTSLVDLEVIIEPDKKYGQWPLQADHCVVDINYGAGFSQQQSVNISLENFAVPISANFGSVLSATPIEVVATCVDSRGQTLAKASLKSKIDTAHRQSSLTLNVINVPMKITSNTVYEHQCKLVYTESKYSWDFDEAPTAVKTDLTSSSSLSELVDITLQQANEAIGYTWRASKQSVSGCGEGGTLTNAYFFQNIGMAVPGDNLKTMNCGFALQPNLSYLNVSPSKQVPVNASFFLDPNNDAFALRPVDLEAGIEFDLNESNTAGRFEENNLIGLSLHPAGYAVATSWANSKMEILPLSDVLTSDSNANRSRMLSGSGTEAGLIKGPVGTAITPTGFILVLEGTGKRVQAFDINGNPTSLFNGSEYLQLKESESASYLDIAVSPRGIIYLLSYTGSGSEVSDYLLDLYQENGSFISRSCGVNGARLAVDSQGIIYTLNYESFVGFNGRTEPSVSKWVPVG